MTTKRIGCFEKQGGKKNEYRKRMLNLVIGRLLVIYKVTAFTRGASQLAQVVKNLPTNSGSMGDLDLIPGTGRSPGAGNGNLFQYSCLENPMN